MEQYYDNDFFLTKEEIIKIRTIYLEYGNDNLINEIREKLPYENVCFLKSATYGYRALDLYEPLLFYQVGESPKLFELELIRYLGVPDYGIEWGFDRFLFVDDLPPEKLKIKLFKRYLYSLEHLNSFEMYYDVDMTGLDSPNERAINRLKSVFEVKKYDKFFDTIELFYKQIFMKLSKNVFFNYLRNGLWYKKYNQFDQAVNYLKKARGLHLHELGEFRRKNLFFDENFDERIKQIQDAGIDEVDTVLPESYVYWWNAYGQTIKIPLELRLEIEETPSYHLGEMYINKGDSFYKKNKFREAYEAYSKAQSYLEEMKSYPNLGFGLKDFLEVEKAEEEKLRETKLVDRYVENFFKDSKEKPSNDEINWVRLKANDLFFSPVYLPLTTRPLKRNPYLEGAIQRCLTKLDMLYEYKKEKTKLLDKPLESQNITIQGFPKESEVKRLQRDFKDISKKIVEKYYLKILNYLDISNKNDFYKAIMYEAIEFSGKTLQFRSVISLLSTITEREINITIRRLNKTHNISFKFNSEDLRKRYLKSSAWEKIQILIKDFGKEYFKIQNSQIDSMIKKIRFLQEMRNSCAHGNSYGGLKDYEIFRTILLGKINKAEEGILYKIINLRYLDNLN